VLRQYSGFFSLSLILYQGRECCTKKRNFNQPSRMKMNLPIWWINTSGLHALVHSLLQDTVLGEFLPRHTAWERRHNVKKRKVMFGNCILHNCSCTVVTSLSVWSATLCVPCWKPMTAVTVTVDSTVEEYCYITATCLQSRVTRGEIHTSYAKAAV
jgi:hypothetical protein